MSTTSLRPGGSLMPLDEDIRDGAAADPVSAVTRLAVVDPNRVVTRYHYRTLTYRELAESLELMLPVIRMQRMDDRAAVVAAVFAGLPALSSEHDPATVASVIDGTLTRIEADAEAGLADSDDGASAQTRVPALGTSEIDLRGIASRLTDV